MEVSSSSSEEAAKALTAARAANNGERISSTDVVDVPTLSVSSPSGPQQQQDQQQQQQQDQQQQQHENVAVVTAAAAAVLPCSSIAGTLLTPAETDARPWDDVAAAGPPTEAIAFPQPRFVRGRRSKVKCYDPSTGQHTFKKNVLFRDYSHGMRASARTGTGTGTDNGHDDDDDDDQEVGRVRRAYWPIKTLSPTIMGHVEMCMVLERQNDDDDDEEEETDSDGDESSCFDAACPVGAGAGASGAGDDDGVVFQLTEQRVAVKVNYRTRMERLRGRHAEDPLKEISAMQLIGNHHPNLLGCYEVLRDGRNYYIVMRYCDGGDLLNLFQKSQPSPSQSMDGAANPPPPSLPPPPPPGLSEGVARYWFRQVIAGVKHLHHTAGICHRDLSPENLVFDRTRGELFIIDMGMCLRVPYNSPNSAAAATVATTDIQTAAAGDVGSVGGGGGGRRRLFLPQGACGKLPYMSPEIYTNQVPFDGAAADVWTCGTILFCMVTGKLSYGLPLDTDPQYYWMTRRLPQLLRDSNVQLSPAGLHLLQNMLRIDPRLRLSLEEVLQHPWFDMPDEIPSNIAAPAAAAAAAAATATLRESI